MKRISPTETLLKDGTLKLAEFEFRPIDANGDSIDPQHADTLAEAEGYIPGALGSYEGKCVAWVIEHHVSYHPSWGAPRGQAPDSYTTVKHGGDEAALIAGGWLD